MRILTFLLRSLLALVRGFGLLPDLGTVAKETYRQQNKGAGITVSLARKQQVTGSA